MSRSPAYRNGEPGRPHPVVLVDTTLRDGEQTPGVAFTASEKLEIVRLLDSMGVPIVSVGFPAVSGEERAAVSLIARAKARGELSCRLSVLCRPTRTDIDMAFDCGVDTFSLLIPVSDIHLRAKFGSEGRDTARRLLEEGCAYAAKRGAAFTVAAEDSTRADYDFLREVFARGAALGAESLMICDTVGVAVPERMAGLVSSLRRDVPDAPLVLHCHDDYGLATANTVAGIVAGAAGASVTFTGIGERTGNAPLEEVALVLMHHYGFELGLKTQLFARAAEVVEAASGISRDPFKPVTGRHAFTHESGIHVRALLKDPRAYHPFPPELVGRQARFVFGKHSGKALVRSQLASEGIEASEEETEALLQAIKREAIDRKRAFEAHELRALWDRLRSAVKGG